MTSEPTARSPITARVAKTFTLSPSFWLQIPAVPAPMPPKRGEEHALPQRSLETLG